MTTMPKCGIISSGGDGPSVDSHILLEIPSNGQSGPVTLDKVLGCAHG